MKYQTSLRVFWIVSFLGLMVVSGCRTTTNTSSIESIDVICGDVSLCGAEPAVSPLACPEGKDIATSCISSNGADCRWKFSCVAAVEAPCNPLACGPVPPVSPLACPAGKVVETKCSKKKDGACGWKVDCREVK